MSGIIHYDRFTPEMRSLHHEACEALRRGDPREFADKNLEAVLASRDTPWTYGRFYLYHGSGDALQEYGTSRT